MTATVTVTERAAARARARHTWIYRSDITDLGHANPGEVVLVRSVRGAVLGKALYSSTSQIALRFVCYDTREIDQDFWNERLAAAVTLREKIVADRSACRLVFGESDLLPSLIVDRYDDCLVIQTLSQGMDALKTMWVELLLERFAPRAIVERNEAKVRDMEGLPRQAGFLLGSADSLEVTIDEAGTKFAVDLLGGQKTGFFLDQAENRIAARTYARGRALDCFSYEGAFALQLARNADSVLAIDSSAKAIGAARRNARLNAIENVEFREANVFDVLRDLDHQSERFDTIALDPPAFAKNRAAIDGARRGYKEINLRAMKMLRPGGTLITSTCSHHMSEDEFLNLLTEAAADAGRSCRIIEKRIQSRDHPILLSMPETFYLKCAVLVLD